MEILQEYDFKRPSRSQYAPVAKALLEDGVFAVKLKRGEDFPQSANVSSVQGAVSTQVRESPKNVDRRRARTFVESDDVLVVSLYAAGEGPAPKRRRSQGRGRAVVNA